MKRIFKLFMAVAAVAGVTACTTDATDDLGVNLNGGQTTLTLSLDDTRTQLGEKADGVYPLTWAENDAISVNGSVSNALTENEAGATTATFTFKNGFGENPTSYFVAYPATSTNNQVVFAAEQTHTSNTTFGNGAAVMYGYATDLSNVTLKHLTGVLKIGLVSETTTPAFIKEVRISTVDRKPIAGAFNVDAEGKFTPVKDATSEVITYKAASDAGIPVPVGTATSENPAYIHVTVPAGVYGELYVTVESADGVMYKTVTTNSSKPLNAGTVRELTNNLVLAPTAETEAFMIADYSDLYEYKLAVEGGNARNAVLVNDIEVPNINDPQLPTWEPINAPNYTGSFNGNGYAIKGLYAPLFNVTAASFKGVHIDAIAVETLTPNFGAFARQIIATTNEPKVEHCSVSGSIVIKTDATPENENVATDAAIGAFVGVASGVHFENCANSATITINQVSTTKNMLVPTGGIVGYTDTANGLFTQFTNCTNSGDITFNDNSGYAEPSLAGIVGYYEGLLAVVTFDNCSNSGDLTTTANSSYRNLNIAGIMGISIGIVSNPKKISFTNSVVNSGIITVKGNCSNAVRIGGIVGYAKNRVHITYNTTVTNKGAITFEGTTNRARIGGIVGVQDDFSAMNCYDDVVVSEEAKITANGEATSSLICGGIVGYTSNSSESNFLRIYNKTIANNAEVTVGAKCGGESYIAGIAGYCVKTKVELFNSGRIINNGKVTANKNSDFTSVTCIAGVFGYHTGTSINYGEADGENVRIGQIANKGDVRYEGKAAGDLYVGGLIGWTTAGMVYLTSFVTTGDVYALGEFNATKVIRVAGVTGGFGNVAFKNVQACCDIYAYYVAQNGDDYTITPYTDLGMFTGRSASINNSNTSDNFIGGRIATTATVVDGKIEPIWEEITENNYFDYVLGKRTGLTSFKGFTYLPSKEDVVWGNYGN